LSCFILLGVHWLLLLVEAFFLRGTYSWKVLRTKKALPFILDEKREKWLYACLIARAFIMVLQLFLGPLVDGLPFWFTALAIVLGFELFGMGFGALTTMFSIQALINTKRQRQYGPVESDSEIVNTEGENTSETNGKWYQNRMAVLVPVAILIGVVIGVIFYVRQ